MKKFFSLSVLFVMASGQAGASVSNRLMDQIQHELPVGTYAGKTHKRGNCQVTVAVSDDARFGEVYRVDLTYEDTHHHQFFNLRLTGEKLSTVGARDLRSAQYRYESGLRPYVAMTNRDPRTHIAVKRDSGVERSLKVLDLNVSSSRPKNKWRVTIGSTSESSEGSPFGDLSCEIDPLL